mmetsp:Transcript_28662/g.66086  ORF Transcript_28662/g.66086 Transcript_28662/m.66086 type:complete len:240 (-) Transcript_28662:435-1154(-)
MRIIGSVKAMQPGPCSAALVRECPLVYVGFLAGKVLDRMSLPPLVDLRIFVNVARLRVSNAVKRCNCGAPQSGQCAEDRTLLFRDFCLLHLINHSVALLHGLLSQFLCSVFATEGLKVAIGHLCVHIHERTLGRWHCLLVGFNRNHLWWRACERCAWGWWWCTTLASALERLLLRALRDEETVEGSFGKLGIGVLSLALHSIDHICWSLVSQLLHVLSLALVLDAVQHEDLTRQAAYCI